MIRILILCLFLLFFASCSRHGIIKSYAYKRQSMAGMVRSDDNGRQTNTGITIQHLLFVETDSSKGPPLWTTAWIYQQPYSIQPVKMNSPNNIIGKTMSGEDVAIRIKKGNELWQLVLSTKRDSTEDQNIQKIKKSKILLLGTWKNKPFSYKISKEEQLQQMEFQ
jgi:hypothetical protein